MGSVIVTSLLFLFSLWLVIGWVLEKLAKLLGEGALWFSLFFFLWNPPGEHVKWWLWNA